MKALDTLVEAVLEAAKRPSDERGRACLSRGLRAFVVSGREPGALLDALVAGIDADLSRQIDAILHHPRFQALESAWRGLWLVVSRMDEKRNLRCEVLNCSKEDLVLDFEDSPEITKSGLYKITYSAEFGPFGGKPLAAILADYQLGADLRDIALLRRCGEVASYGCVPFLAAAHPSLLRTSAVEIALGAGAELEARVLAAWRAFRDDGCARFAGLVVSRCLGRAAYGAREGSSLRYDETIGRPEDLLWQSGVFALGTCLVRSFALWGLGANVTGPVGGVVDDLPTWRGPLGDWPAPLPVEIPLSDEREQEIAGAGVIPLGVDSRTGQALFRAAPTCLAPTAAHPALPPPDQDLHRQLPALFVISRFAHYIKVLQREMIGAWRTPETLSKGLQAYLDQWVHREETSDVEGNSVGPYRTAPYRLRTRYPLRRADLRVDDAGPRNGFYWFELRLQPNWSLSGRFFTLVIEGKLDKE